MWHITISGTCYRLRNWQSISLAQGLHKTLHQSIYKVLRMWFLQLLLLLCYYMNTLWNRDLDPINLNVLYERWVSQITSIEKTHESKGGWRMDFCDLTRITVARDKNNSPCSLLFFSIWEIMAFISCFAGTLCCIPAACCGSLTWALQHSSNMHLALQGTSLKSECRLLPYQGIKWWTLLSRGQIQFPNARIWCNFAAMGNPSLPPAANPEGKRSWVISNNPM